MINICSLVFQCGCGWIWGAAATHCNIHTPGVRHCPWCVHPTVYYASGGFIIAAQFAISFWPNRWPWVYRLAAALAAFPVLGVTLAGAYGLVSGYWS